MLRATAEKPAPAHRRARVWAMGAIAAVAFVSLVPTAWAQERFDPESVERGRAIFRDKSLCAYCHGWNGMGANVVSQPPAPALVTTQLDRESIREVVRCGRPDTRMPHHSRTAWNANDPCYGMTKADVEQIPPPPYTQGGWLRDEEIEDLLNFIQAEIQGQEIDLDYCQKYYGENARQCEAF